MQDFRLVAGFYVKLWTFFFKMVHSVKFKKPLTHCILSNPNHEFVKTLIYIYSMETFVLSAMNQASRNKDIDKIKLYGPLASALSYIVHCSNGKNAKFNKVFAIYRV